MKRATDGEIFSESVSRFKTSIVMGSAKAGHANKHSLQPIQARISCATCDLVLCKRTGLGLSILSAYYFLSTFSIVVISDMTTSYSRDAAALAKCCRASQLPPLDWCLVFSLLKGSFDYMTIEDLIWPVSEEKRQVCV